MSAGTIPPEDLQYGLDVTGLDPASLNDAVQSVMADVMADPARMAMWMTKLSIAEQTAALNMLRRLAGERAEPSVKPAGSDRRFTDPAWQSNPFLAGFLEQYLARTEAALALVDESRVPEATRRKARFAMTMLSDALAPSNVPWMNPAVVKEAINTGGTSLVRGLQNFVRDARENGGMPRQVDSSGFELGVNLAATPGRIVYRNELDRTDRLRTADSAGTRDPAALQPAVDQQVLHHGPLARSIVRRMGNPPRTPNVCDQLPQSRRHARTSAYG